MKSTIININNDTDNLNVIFDETQKISAYVNLDQKQALRLRLLSEELVGMLKELSGNFEGEFWVEAEDLNIDLIVRIYVIDAMDNKTKKSFIDVSSQKKNAAAKGIMGKIRDVVENMMYPEDAALTSDYITSGLGVDAMLYSENQNGETENTAAENIVDNIMLDNSWSLNNYKHKQRENKGTWDEIEKSIIANIADDVKVSVKGKDVMIIVSKNFA
jgi:hypothetical protein